MELSNLKYFVMFMGYPRSGHTVVRSVINSNPNAICSNQLNFLPKLKRYNKEILFAEIVNQKIQSKVEIEKVPKRDITVIGDKTGHRTTVYLESNPNALNDLKTMVEVPIKWIHVVRNPYDNIATWSRLNFRNKKNSMKKREVMQDVIVKYRNLNFTIEKLRETEDVLTVHHEFMCTRMHETLERISDFLEIDFDPQWRENVKSSVWKSPRKTRQRMPWTGHHLNAVKKMVNTFSWLQGYAYNGGCRGCGK